MPTVVPPDLRTPKLLPDFQRMFPNEAACIDYLYARRFPNGFDCPRCGVTGEPFRFSNRSGVVRCRACRRDTSLTANTVIHRSKVPISTWFWGAYLVTHGPPGISALQLQKWLGMSRYETAFQMLHKLRAAMVRPNRDLIGSKYPVEVDETLVGGATQGEGKGVHHKTLVIGAVEVQPRQAIPFAGEDPNLIRGQAREEAKGAARKGIRRKTEPKCANGGHGRSVVAGRLRLQVVANRKQETLVPFVQETVPPGAIVRTDGWTGYDPLQAAGYSHDRVAVRGDHAISDAHLPMIHIVFGNLDAWLLGTHHGVSPKHLQAYLNEFVFRFNRRFWPTAAFDAVLRLGTQTAGPTYAGIYQGTWVHPASSALPQETEWETTG
jgi:transposase-like protein